MEKSSKFALPSPNFNKTNAAAASVKPHYLTPSGMTLLPRSKQPPPMYGPRGTTVPAKFLNSQTAAAPPSSKPSEPQFCEACEMELQSEEDFRRHKAQHQRCEIDGCTYRGHPSVMDKHAVALHSSGVFDMAKKLSTPEEIAAWREERKKRYPTVANVEMRRKAQEQRQKRGERLEASKSRFGKREDRVKMVKGERAFNKKAAAEEAQGDRAFNKKASDEVQSNQKETPDSRKKRNANRNMRRKKAKNAQAENKPQHKQEVKEVKPEVKEKSEEVEETTCDGVPMFRGTSKLKDYKHLRPKKKQTEKVTNVLTNLLGMYGSDDDEENESDNENDENHTDGDEAEEDTEATEIREDHMDTKESDVQIKPALTNEHSQDDSEITPKTTTETSMSIDSSENKSIGETVEEAQEDTTEKGAASDDAPDEAPIAKSSNIPDLPDKTEPPRKRPKVENSSQRPRQRKLKSGLDYRKARLRKQNTMLEKLLEPDIRHERNVLLQCVRFVCENNYFGVGQKESAATEESKKDLS